MICIFETHKKEQDKLKECISSFLKKLPDVQLSKELLYSTTLSALFMDMRKSYFSDDDIDNIIFRSAYPSNTSFYAVNNNYVAL
jgi:hypothetical protein